jgi:hypothetical protein
LLFHRAASGSSLVPAVRAAQNTVAPRGDI